MKRPYIVPQIDPEQARKSADAMFDSLGDPQLSFDFGDTVDVVSFVTHHGRPPRQTNEALRLTARWAKGTL